MDKAKRKAIIAGNWKMNKTASEAAVLVDELIPAVKDTQLQRYTSASSGSQLKMAKCRKALISLDFRRFLFLSKFQNSAEYRGGE